MTAKQSDLNRVFGGDEVPIPTFSTGEVAEILDVPIWRLQKFLDVETYPLSPSGQIGRGHGSRRTFMPKDIYRLGVASRLVRDSFTPKLVVKILQYIEDEELIGSIDEEGNTARGGIFLTRGRKGTEIRFFSPGRPPQITAEGAEYYALDLDYLIGKMDERINDVLHKRKKSKQC